VCKNCVEEHEKWLHRVTSGLEEASCGVHLIPVSDDDVSYCLVLGRTLRQNDIPCLVDSRPVNMKRKLRYAADTLTPFAVIVGGDERSADVVIVRDMDFATQEVLSTDDAVKFLKWMSNPPETTEDVMRGFDYMTQAKSKRGEKKHAPKVPPPMMNTVVFWAQDSHNDDKLIGNRLWYGITDQCPKDIDAGKLLRVYAVHDKGTWRWRPDSKPLIVSGPASPWCQEGKSLR
jgi:Anticodon binding domain